MVSQRGQARFYFPPQGFAFNRVQARRIEPVAVMQEQQLSTVLDMAKAYGHGTATTYQYEGHEWFLVGNNASHMFYLREDEGEGSTVVWRLSSCEDGDNVIIACASLADVGYIGHY